jgi:hypothetical protein
MMKSYLFVGKVFPLLMMVVMVGLFSSPSAPAISRWETRCGWFSNPTPANAWLHDKDGEWMIGVQGGHQAEGDWPDFKAQQWVETNGHYGYGCACFRVRVNHKTHEVLEIKSSYARSLSACRKDRALKEPK